MSVLFPLLTSTDFGRANLASKARGNPLSQRLRQLSMISLAQRITDHITCHHMCGNASTPTKLLLGQAEWNALNAMRRSDPPFSVPLSDSPAARPEYSGMKLYRVDDESFLAVL